MEILKYLFGQYEYRIFRACLAGKKDGEAEGWTYEIYNLDKKPELIVKSNEWFDTKGHARLAAIGHISLLENGERYDD